MRKSYIDRFVKENYGTLQAKFRSISLTINSKCNSSLDKLNDTILALYEGDDRWESWEEAERTLKRKFTEKTKREPQPQKTNSIDAADESEEAEEPQR